LIRISASGKTGSIIQAGYFDQEQNDLEPKRFELIANHFTNQLVQTVAYLPSYPLYTDIDFVSKMMIGKLDRYYGGIFYSPQSYVKELPFWWTDWSGKIPIKSLVSVAVVVYLISSGISASWKKDRTIALYPLLSYLGYITIYSLVKASGGRFLQEIDWIALVYFSIGVVEVLSYIIRNQSELIIPPRIDIPHKDKIHQEKPRNPFLVYSAIMIVLLTAGSLPVIVERSIPSLYPDEVLSNKTREILQYPQELLQAEEQDWLTNFINNDGTALIGRAYYPRYFGIGENLEDIRPEVLGNKEDRYEYQRTEFYLIGSDTSWVLLMKKAITDVFPHGSEVFTIGCQQDGVLDALVVILLDDEGTIRDVYWRDGGGNENLSCPLLWPGDEQISTILQDYDEPQKMKIW